MNEMPGSAFATHGGIPYSLRRCSVRRVAERTVTTPVRPSRPNQRDGSAVAHSLACGATQLRVLLVAGVPHGSAELAGVHGGVPHLGSLACTGNTVAGPAMLLPQASVMAAASEHRGFGAGGTGAGSGEACKGDTAGNVDTHTMSDSVLTSVDAVDSPLIAQGATQLAASIRSGDTTSVEVTRAFLARIRRVNPRVNAVVEINPSAEEVRHIQRAATPWRIACGDPCVLVCTARYCPRQ